MSEKWEGPILVVKNYILVVKNYILVVKNYIHYLSVHSRNVDG
jgi:hypothetical protein